MGDKEIWICVECTLENQVTDLICQACDYPSPKYFETQTDCKKKDEKPKQNSLMKLLNEAKGAASRYMNNNNKKESRRHNSDESLEVKKEANNCTDAGGTGDVSTEENPISESVKNIEINEAALLSPPPPQQVSSKLKRQKSKQTEVVRKNHVEDALDRWKDIVEFCKEMKMSFEDDSFPPIAKSLTFDGKQVLNMKMWLRPTEISLVTKNKTKWAVFRNPRPSDIIQGIIGNCWFLSALAVVCEKIELLEQIVITKEICPQGAYQVRICKDGKWVIILVDDHIPCDTNASPLYSQAARNQLWVPLIEKAVAKSFGCYEALIAGRCIEALQMLTGMPCESVVLQNKPSDIPEDQVDIALVWARILTCRKAGYLMAASCGGDVVDEGLVNHFHDVGLEAQHAYSVLDVQHVNNNNRLIRLRNPWGRYSWRGAWSDHSEEWTDELRSRLDPHGSVEGVFWISIEDMINYFDCIDVCKYQPEWTEVTFEGCFASPLMHTGEVYVVNVLVPTELEMTLFQESNRGSKTDSLADLDLMIGIYRAAQSDGSEPKLVSYVEHSNRKIKPSVLCSVFLDPGTYTIVPFAFNHWNSGVQYESAPKYVISIHSSNPVLVDQVAMPRYTLSDALFLMVEKLGKKHVGINGVTCYYMSYHLAGLIVAAENCRPDVHLHVDCDCSNSFNVVATRGALKTQDCLPPRHRQVLTILTQLEGAEGYAVTHKLRFRISPKNGFNSYGSHQHPLLVNGLGEVHNPRPM